MYMPCVSQKRIKKILQSTTKVELTRSVPKPDQRFTYGNGIKTLVASLFVSIVDADLLLEKPDEKTARLLRSFYSEMIAILKDDDNYRDIGIRGSCVYCIYNAPKEEDCVNIFFTAVKINTFMIMFNKLLDKYGYKNIKIGIGLGFSCELIIKAGKAYYGINDNIWIGRAVVDAAHISLYASKDFSNTIGISGMFYKRFHGELLKKYPCLKEKFKVEKEKCCYSCDLVLSSFKEWIMENV